MSSSWACQLHGTTFPAMPPQQPAAAPLKLAASRSPVPLWIAWPLPRGWVVSGLLQVGDDVTGVRATAICLSGPNPLGGPAEMALVAEEPGIGLGARLASLPGPDPGHDLASRPYVKLEAAGRPTPLWHVEAGPDRAAAVGEAYGLWLWAVLRPATAGVMLMEDLALADVRELGDEVDLLPFGALAPWLSEPA